VRRSPPRAALAGFPDPNAGRGPEVRAGKSPGSTTRDSEPIEGDALPARVLGFATAYPVNVWLIRRGVKEAM
jgi:hypothetical protein